MKTKIALVILLVFLKSFAQDIPFSSKEISVNPLIDGTLLLPTNTKKPNLVILIAGSGPTDRNGNQSYLKTNTLKKLAEGLSKNNIATFRYDKRIVKQLKNGHVDMTIMFDDFITDANSVIDYFKNDKTYNHIYILGHSQGSLVGMLAAKDKADGFISIAGAARSIDNIIIEQIEKTYPVFLNDTKRIFNILKSGKKTTNYPVELAAVFNIQIQSFMINWMKYNPKEDIKNLDLKILIINGTKDLQVEVKEAELLKASSPNATLKLIENMNHVLVNIEGDSVENSKSYNEPLRPISQELIEAITNFVK